MQRNLLSIQPDYIRLKWSICKVLRYLLPGQEGNHIILATRLTQGLSWQIILSCFLFCRVGEIKCCYTSELPQRGTRGDGWGRTCWLLQSMEDPGRARRCGTDVFKPSSGWCWVRSFAPRVLEKVTVSWPRGEPTVGTVRGEHQWEKQAGSVIVWCTKHSGTVLPWTGPKHVLCACKTQLQGQDYVALRLEAVGGGQYTMFSVLS